MKQLSGGILLAVGILIAGGSGLCSLAILFGSGEFSGLEMLPAVLLIGGIPLLIGVGMAFGGRALLRSAREEDSQP
ncbi:MAG TPA: hypothetical protein VFH89_05655 [Sphingomicrobium sp.]|nr:hypothetical protein [Sphingomicrobium sp.]